MFRSAITPSFQNRLRHLLNEQRNTIGTFDDFLPNPFCDWVAADNAIDHDFNIDLRQPIKRKCRHVRSADP